MLTYNDLQSNGEIWMRAPNGERYPANQVLSSIYIKYDTVSETFYNDLTSNSVSNFDVIYDTLHITTTAGSIFEKIYAENGQLLPHNQSNLFHPICSSPLDYWFSESKNKIYYTDIIDVYKGYTSYSNLSALQFFLTFNIFDCTQGITTYKSAYQITLQPKTGADWRNNLYTIETPKITYNPDTYIFNISFLIKNDKNLPGIVSLNLKDNENYDIIECNTCLPYFNTSTTESKAEKISYEEIPLVLRPPADPYFNNNILLLHMDGVSGSRLFIDNSPTNAQMLTAGFVMIDTARFRYGNASAFFNRSATTSLRTSAIPSVFNLGTGDFTIEGWFFFRENNIGYQPLMSSYVAGDQTGWLLTTEVNHFLNFYSASNTTWNNTVASTTRPTLSTWTHIAVTRQNGTINIYTSGINVTTTRTGGSNPVRLGNFVAIGHYPFYPAPAVRTFDGYIDDIRITKGVARYTTNFTPPTYAFSDY
jgi:hypothetical protein